MTLRVVDAVGAVHPLQIAQPEIIAQHGHDLLLDLGRGKARGTKRVHGATTERAHDESDGNPDRRNDATPAAATLPNRWPRGLLHRLLCMRTGLNVLRWLGMLHGRLPVKPAGNR